MPSQTFEPLACGCANSPTCIANLPAPPSAVKLKHRILSARAARSRRKKVTSSRHCSTRLRGGLYAGLGGTLSLILPTPANQATYGSEFTWDGVAYPVAPYFSASGSSGILLYDSAGYLLNPYFDPTNDTYYVWLASGAPGSESNPGNLVGIMTADITQTTGGASATPLPATWAMMLGGLVFLGWMARRRKTSNKDARGWDLATA